jgi:protein phosphatase
MLTVIDATNVQPEARREALAVAREHDSMVFGIVFNLPEAVCHLLDDQFS